MVTDKDILALVEDAREWAKWTIRHKPEWRRFGCLWQIPLEDWFEFQLDIPLESSGSVTAFSEVGHVQINARRGDSLEMGWIDLKDTMAYRKIQEAIEFALEQGCLPPDVREWPR